MGAFNQIYAARSKEKASLRLKMRWRGAQLEALARDSGPRARCRPITARVVRSFVNWNAWGPKRSQGSKTPFMRLHNMLVDMRELSQRRKV